MPTSILIIDDEPKMSSVLARMLGRDGYDAHWTDNPAEALELLQSRPFDIVLSDLRMPGLTGIEVLERGKRANPNIDFVMMTAYATPQTAVESMKKGALDYLIKPFAIEDLRALVKRIEQSRGSALPGQPGVQPATAGGGAVGLPASEPDSSGEAPALIAHSVQMREVMARVRKVAASNASTLISGESGTGKEIIARTIHSMSPRAGAPLITVNCGAIPENLMESELFGHIKGSFTGAVENRIGVFEAANTGTIFLDEIGELPLHLQVKLLRVLQEGEVQRVGESTTRKVDVRVIAATNRDLERETASGRFRQDLFYRLNVIPVSLPPLRDRREDLQPLIDLFLKRYAPAGQAKSLSSDAATLLLHYDYPGNIRELENAIEHAVVLSEGGVIHPADLPLHVQNALGGLPSDLDSKGGGAPGGSQLDEIEKRCILDALEKSRYNFTRAAAHLGITRRTLGYRIQKHGLEEHINRHRNIG